MSDLPAFLHDVLGARERGLVHPRAPQFVAPMLSRTHREPVSDPNWVYERKLGGARVVVVRDLDGAHLYSADGTAVTADHPAFVRALGHCIPPGTVADGEVVGTNLFLFDVTVVFDHDVTALPLRARRRLLDECTELSGPVRAVGQTTADGTARLAQACRDGWSGLVAKRSDAPYRAGLLSRDWLTLDCA